MAESEEDVGARGEAGRGSRHIQWYRTPIDRALLARLNTRSDARGLFQTVGYLSLLLLTGGVALSAVGRWPWWAVVLTLFLHGTVASFSINAVHELVHRTVFRTLWLNDLFVRVFAFISWVNFPHFYRSHMRHHQYTLHPPDDLEVVLPIRLMVKDFVLRGFVNVRGMYDALKTALRHSRGKFEGDWEAFLFHAEQPENGRPVVRWARTALAGHGAILVLSVYSGLWLLPVLTSCIPLYGSWLFFLCNNTQHIGLQDNVPDFRLCSRTFTVNPFVGFLYWHMNFHIEHHMYAAVPCYNLSTLHRAIVDDLPLCPDGIGATWKQIAAIQKRQEREPGYQHVAQLPG